MKLTPLDPPPWTHFEFPSTLENARSAEIRILGECVDRRFSEDDLFAIRMALHEALVNAVVHGNKVNPATKVRVGYALDARRIDISIQDQGDGFNPATLPDPTADENLARPSGRGILLMRAFMDAVVFSPLGNRVTMTKYANPSSPPCSH